MAEPNLLVRRDGPVLHLVLNRPDRLNALDSALHEAILAALRAAEDDPEVRAVALSGAGRAFCAGDDIKPRGSGDWPARLAHRDVELDHGVGPLLLIEVTAALRALPKPTVALMHGYAVGAGYDYASACDLRLATRDCRIGDPRIKLALWGAEGWSYKLPRLVGQTYVAPIAYLGEPMSGEEAAEIGFVHRLLDPAEPVLDAARDLLHRLAALDPESYRRTKSRLLRDLDRSWDEATHAGRDARRPAAPMGAAGA